MKKKILAKKLISIFLVTTLMSIGFLVTIPTNVTAYPYVLVSDSTYNQGTNSVEITVSFDDTGYYEGNVGISEFKMSGSWDAEDSGTPSGGAIHYDRLGNSAVYVPCSCIGSLENPPEAGTYKIDVTVHVYLETLDPMTGGTGWGEGGLEDFTLYFTFIPLSSDDSSSTDSSSTSDSGNDVSHGSSKESEENRLPILGEMEQYLLVIIIAAITIAVIMMLPSKKRKELKTAKRLELLEEKFLKDEISEETYRELKKKYEQG